MGPTTRPDVPIAERRPVTPQITSVPQRHAPRKTRPVIRPGEGRLPETGATGTALALGPLQTVMLGQVGLTYSPGVSISG